MAANATHTNSLLAFLPLPTTPSNSIRPAVPCTNQTLNPSPASPLLTKGVSHGLPLPPRSAQRQAPVEAAVDGEWQAVEVARADGNSQSQLHGLALLALGVALTFLKRERRAGGGGGEGEGGVE